MLSSGILRHVALVSSSPILLTLTMEELGSSETSVSTRATRRNITEDAILLVSQNCLAISPLRREGVLHNRRRKFVVCLTEFSGLRKGKADQYFAFCKEE
jgi:hypothetical protein